MSVPLSADARISIHYVVDTLSHVSRVYCKISGLPVTPKAIIYRDGLTTQTWSTAAQALWTAMRPLFAPSVGAATASLESRSGLNWFVEDTATLTGVGTGPATLHPASELIFALRDDAHKQVKVAFLEHGLDYVGHSATGLTLGGTITALTHQFDGTVVAGDVPFNWVKSRGDRYLLAAGNVAGVTLGLNYKVKRARHAA